MEHLDLLLVLTFKIAVEPEWKQGSKGFSLFPPQPPRLKKSNILAPKLKKKKDHFSNLFWKNKTKNPPTNQPTKQQTNKQKTKSKNSCSSLSIFKEQEVN